MLFTMTYGKPVKSPFWGVCGEFYSTTSCVLVVRGSHQKPLGFSNQQQQPWRNHEKEHETYHTCQLTSSVIQPWQEGTPKTNYLPIIIIIISWEHLAWTCSTNSPGVCAAGTFLGGRCNLSRPIYPYISLSLYVFVQKRISGCVCLVRWRGPSLAIRRAHHSAWKTCQAASAHQAVIDAQTVVFSLAICVWCAAFTAFGF